MKLFSSRKNYTKKIALAAVFLLQHQGFFLRQYRIIRQEQAARDFEFEKRHFFAGILFVFQEKITHFQLKRAAGCQSRYCAVLP